MLIAWASWGGIKPSLGDSLKINCRGVHEAQALHFLALAPLARAVARSLAGNEVRVALVRAAGVANLRVEDKGGDVEPPDLLGAIEAFALQLNGEAEGKGGTLEVKLPL